MEKAPNEFKIDMLLCIFCGFCQEVCPDEAIFLMKDFSLTGLSRQEIQRSIDAGMVERIGRDKDWKRRMARIRLSVPAQVARALLPQRSQDALRRLVERARKRGVGVYLYLNEPRAMPLAFYAAHPELKGVVEGDHAALPVELLADAVEVDHAKSDRGPTLCEVFHNVVKSFENKGIYG